MYFKRTKTFQLLLTTLVLSVALFATLFTEPALAQGRIVTDTITSPSLEGNLLGDSATREITIYLPPSYDTSDMRYPVAYYLPGWGNVTFDPSWDDPFVSSDDVPEGGLDGMFDDMIAAGDMKEMIIVVPEGNNKYGGSMYTNSEVTGNHEDYIVQDVVSYIDANYRTSPNRNSRAIAGHSMGGYGAMKLAMKHPDVFGTVAAHVPFLYFEGLKPIILSSIEENPDGMTGPSPDKIATSMSYAASAAFSPNAENPPFYVDLAFEYPSGEIIDEVWDRWLEHDPFTTLPAYSDNLASLRGIYFEAADKDDYGFNYHADAFHQALDAVGIKHEYVIFDGGHSDTFYDRLPFSLSFLSDKLVSDADLEANKAVRRRLYEEVWNQGNLDVIDEIYAPEHTYGIYGSAEGFKQYVMITRAAFPDLHITINDEIAQGDLVATRVTAAGTHTGEFMGIPPTGVVGVRTGIAIARVVDGKINMVWENHDELGMMQQLGVIPPTRDGYAWYEPSEVMGEPGDPETNKAIVRRIIDEIWLQGNLQLADELIHPDHHFNEAPGGPSSWGIDAYKENIALWNSILSDMHINIDALLAEGDKVAIHVTNTGTHTGTLFGMPATMKQIEFSLTAIMHIADGKIVETWMVKDSLGIVEQIQQPPKSDTDANKAVTLKRYESYNQRNLDALDEIFTVDSYDHDQIGGDANGLEERKAFMAGFLATYPDAHWTVDDVVAGGDFVAGRITITGTSEDIPFVATGIAIDRFVDSKIAETWTHADYLGAAEQGGDMPKMRDSYEWGEPSDVTGDPGAPEANMEIIRRAIEEIWNQGNTAVADELFHPDYIYNEPGMVRIGVDLLKDAVIEYRSAFPDLHVSIDQIFAEDDKVVASWTFTGIHTGTPFKGIPTTGKSFGVQGVNINRIADGKIVESWWCIDRLSLLMQLMSATPEEINKAVRTRLYEEINKHNLDIFDEIYADDYVGDLGVVENKEVTKQTFAAYFAAFPDLHFTADDMIAEGDLIATRWTATSTHKGEFMGIPPTNKQMTVTGIAIAQIVNGKQKQIWEDIDELGMMQQLGVLPPDREVLSWGEPLEITGEPGDPDTNKGIVLRLGTEVWNQGNLDIADELLHPDHFINEAGYPMRGIDVYKGAVAEWRSDLPDLNVKTDLIFAEGDKVVTRWTLTGTHTGTELMGLPATGKQLEVTGITINRIANGKAVESWWSVDRMALMQQLTAEPEEPTEDYSNVFFMSLQPGLNMISLPLKSQTPYTARSFAETLSATVVIKLDEVHQRFVGFTLDAPDDGFAIEGGKGYVVNVSEAKVVTFTGAAWTNEPPVEAAPILTQNDGAWAYVVSGRLEDASNDSLNKDGYWVTVRNIRTNAVTTDVVREGYFAAAFADLSRKNVVQMSDLLEVTVRDRVGEVASETYAYTVTAESIRQAFLPIILRNVGIPRQSLLLQNYPNPFNPETWIPYQIREPADVVIRIYNAKGQLVRTLDLGQRAAGFYRSRTRAAHWDGHNDAGEKVASGIYFYLLKTGDFFASRKMIIVK